MKKKYILAGILIILAGILLGCGVFYTQEYLESKNNQYQEPTEDKQSNNNETQNDKTEKNDITQYIKDKDYQIVDKNSSLVKDLYNKIIYSQSMLDNYIQEKITNDTIITLTLRQMEENKDYEKNCYIDDKYDTGLETGDWIFSNTLFDSYAKKLFGPMVNYDITKYNGAGNGCDYYIYDSKINKLISSSGTGCAFAEEILTKADYAYTFTKAKDGNYYYTDFSRLN